MKTRSSMLGMFAAGTCAAALMLSGCGGGGGGPNLAQFCKDNTTLASQFGSVADLDNGGPSSIADFKEASAAVKKVETHAPSDVKGDIKLVVSALDDAAAHGTASFDAESTQAAIGRISAYVHSNCDGESTDTTS